MPRCCRKILARKRARQFAVSTFQAGRLARWEAIAGTGKRRGHGVVRVLKRILQSRGARSKRGLGQKSRTPVLAHDLRTQFSIRGGGGLSEIPNELWHELRSEITGQKRRFSTLT